MSGRRQSVAHGLERVTRRASLVRLGGALLAALAAAGSRASGSSGAPGHAARAPRATTAGGVSCVLSPEQTEGPYYLEVGKLRRDVREGKPGVPLWLRATVVDASSCKPIRGAVVDIWHCDAGGTYSGFAREGTAGRTFLRGIQRTDRKGLALFRTIYPGWYPGRTVHIHVLVHVGGNVVHTGQVYFPDKLTDAVYRRRPYSRRPVRDTRNGDDFIFRDGGSRSMVRLVKRGNGYVGHATLGVRRV